MGNKPTVEDAAEILLRSRDELWSASVAVFNRTGKAIDANSVHELLMELATREDTQQDNRRSFTT